LGMWKRLLLNGGRRREKDKVMKVEKTHPVDLSAIKYAFSFVH